MRKIAAFTRVTTFKNCQSWVILNLDSKKKQNFRVKSKDPAKGTNIFPFFWWEGIEVCCSNSVPVACRAGPSPAHRRAGRLGQVHNGGDGRPPGGPADGRPDSPAGRHGGNAGRCRPSPAAQPSSPAAQPTGATEGWANCEPDNTDSALWLALPWPGPTRSQVKFWQITTNLSHFSTSLLMELNRSVRAVRLKNVKTVSLVKKRVLLLTRHPLL